MRYFPCAKVAHASCVWWSGSCIGSGRRYFLYHLIGNTGVVMLRGVELPKSSRGEACALPPSHTTWHTCSVPRRFLLALNFRYLWVRLTSPWSENQALDMARQAWGVSDKRHHPLPERANIHASSSRTPHSWRKSAMALARLHCFSLRHRSFRRIHSSSLVRWLLHCAK